MLKSGVQKRKYQIPFKITVFKDRRQINNTAGFFIFFMQIGNYGISIKKIKKIILQVVAFDYFTNLCPYYILKMCIKFDCLIIFFSRIVQSKFNN